MNNSLLDFDRQVRDAIARAPALEVPFEALALQLFALQYQWNERYRKICERRALSPASVSEWSQIPAVPVSAFKQVELTVLAPAERNRMFLSSGTTAHQPSRHFHSNDSVGLYEHSLLAWFKACFARHLSPKPPMLFLTPPPAAAPHSSLAHMFGVFRNAFGAQHSRFLGAFEADESWSVDFTQTLEALQALAVAQPVFLAGTAFNFVHLADELKRRNAKVSLPPGSVVLETGGYKNRSRSLPKRELYQLISETLGLPVNCIFAEYGMCELSSQAYDVSLSHESPRRFRFPPWVRVQAVSPETNRPVPLGQPGLLRIFDLANVYSVMAVQTDDLAIVHQDGFELLGRAATAEPRGCSMLSAEAAH